MQSWKYCTTLHATTNQTPAFLFLDRNIWTRLDILWPSLEKTVTNKQANQPQAGQWSAYLQLRNKSRQPSLCQKQDWLHGFLASFFSSKSFSTIDSQLPVPSFETPPFDETPATKEARSPQILYNTTTTSATDLNIFTSLIFRWCSMKPYLNLQRTRQIIIIIHTSILRKEECIGHVSQMNNDLVLCV